MGLEWYETWGRSGTDRAEAIGLDRNGSVYVAGFSYNPSLAKDEMVVLKYNSSGEFVWNTYISIGVDPGARALGLVVNNNSEVFICGYEWTVQSLIYVIPRVVIAKLDAQGNVLWIKRAIWYCSIANDLALDSLGNLYTIGFGPEEEFILVKFDYKGDFQWVKYWGSANDVGQSIVFDDSAQCLIGSGHSIGAGSFLVKFNLSGDVLSETSEVGGVVNQFDSVDPTRSDMVLRSNMVLNEDTELLIPGFTGNFELGTSNLCLYNVDTGLIQPKETFPIDNSRSVGMGLAIVRNSSQYICVGSVYNDRDGDYDGLIVSYTYGNMPDDPVVPTPISPLLLILFLMTGLLAIVSMGIATHQIKRYLLSNRSNRRKTESVPDELSKKASLDYFVYEFEEIFGDEWDNSEEKAKAFWKWLKENKYKVEW